MTEVRQKIPLGAETRSRYATNHNSSSNKERGENNGNGSNTINDNLRRMSGSSNGNCDVLLIGDSNIRKLQPDIMDNVSKCEKIECFKIRDLSNIIDTLKLQRPPTKVYIQAGTNDLERESCEAIMNELEKSIHKIESKFNNP